MVTEVILVRANIPDRNGRVFTEEALRKIAEKTPDVYSVDKDGRLHQKLTLTEAVLLEKLLAEGKIKFELDAAHRSVGIISEEKNGEK